MGWNESTGVQAPKPNCLNPFFIRAWVGTFGNEEAAAAWCLNPFFIRAWVGTQRLHALRGAQHVLIPSSSGHGLEPQPRKHQPLLLRLNPFFIRAWVGTIVQHYLRLVLSLNPFFIRAWVGTCHNRTVAKGAQVLIPSSSGHGLELKLMKAKASITCLNPFFIRAWVGTVGMLFLSTLFRS